jgi:hypothetical protein
MSEEANQQNSSRENLLNHFFHVMKENEHFLYKDARDIYDEVIELIHDAIDFAHLTLSQKDYSNRAMNFFLLHVFMPQSYAIYVDLLSGNLPICFGELRLMVESLAKSFSADYMWKEDKFFGEKLEMIEEYRRKENKSITNLIERAENNLGIQGDFSDLWRRLSNEWIHAGGLMKRVVDYVANRQDAPPWGLVIPMRYNQNDLPDINDLRQEIIRFRRILNTIMKEEQMVPGLET